MNLYVSSWHARNKWKSMILNTNSQESFSSIGKIRSNEKRTNDLIPGINTITTTHLVNYKRCRIFSWIWKLLFMFFWFSFFLGPKVVSIIILWCIKFWSLLQFCFFFQLLQWNHFRTGRSDLWRCLCGRVSTVEDIFHIIVRNRAYFQVKLMWNSLNCICNLK